VRFNCSALIVILIFSMSFCIKVKGKLLNLYPTKDPYAGLLNSSAYPTKYPYPGLRALRYCSVSFSETHCTIRATFVFGEMFCGSEASQHSSIRHNLNFLWYASKHSPMHKPTSHSLHFICTLFRIPRAEQIRQFTLKE
jgi:hypothetical protein